MRTRRIYVFGPWEFSSKEAVHERGQQILAEYPMGAALVGDDLAFMLALLREHPRYAEKAGAGIAKLVVQRNGSGQKEFGIVRVDGSRDNFSYRKILTPLSARTEVNKALRREILPQIQAFRDEALRRRNESFELDTWHVDHLPPSFEEMRDNWLRGMRLTLDDLALIPVQDGDGLMLADREFAASWQRYHQRHARLDLKTRVDHVERHRSTAPRPQPLTVDGLFRNVMERGGQWTIEPEHKFNVTPRTVLTAEELAFIRANREAFHRKVLELLRPGDLWIVYKDERYF